MESNVKRSQKSLLLGFATIIFLFILLTYYYMVSLSDSVQRLEAISEHTDQKISLINKMHSAARERIVTLYRMASTDDTFLREELFNKFNQYGTRFILAREALLKLELSPLEAKLLKKQDTITVEVGNIQREIASMLLAGEEAKARNLLIERASPVQSKMFDFFHELSDLLELQDAEIVDEAKTNYVKTRNFLIVLALSILLLTILIARSLMRRVLDSEKALENEKFLLTEEKEKALVTLYSIADGVISTDYEGNVQQMNKAAERLTGHTLRQAVGESLSEVLHLVNATSGKQLDPVKLCHQQNAATEPRTDTMLINRSGEEFAIEYSVAPINIEHVNEGYIIVFRDVSHLHQMAQQLAHQASHDSLTGLINRGEFERVLAESLDEVHRYPEHQHWLCYIDLDRFKEVNDSCGHQAGDALLQQIAQTLKHMVRETDQVARIGGDEFAVLLRYCDISAAEQTAERIRHALEEMRFNWEGEHFNVSGSLGVVAIEPENSDIDLLQSHADTACYVSKKSGRNCLHIYQPSDEAIAIYESEKEQLKQLQLAIEQQRFTLYGQRLQSLKSMDNYDHIEVLIRMLDESGECVSPAHFIPLAERHHKMKAIDEWVINHSFGQLIDYLENHSTDNAKLVLSINLSAQTIGDHQMLQLIEQHFKQYPTLANHICFEITETATIANLNEASAFVQTLRKQGCRFSLDDFGSGLSSYGYLKSLPVDYLKIDGSFVRDMLNDPIDSELIRSMNEIGHLLGIQTIAEFVDNKEKLDKLKTIGVDIGQGFYIHRPEPLENLL